MSQADFIRYGSKLQIYGKDTGKPTQIYRCQGCGCEIEVGHGWWNCFKCHDCCLAEQRKRYEETE